MPRKPAAPKAPKLTEKEESKQCIELLRLYGVYAWVNTTTTRTVITPGQSYTKTFSCGKKGTSDLIGFVEVGEMSGMCVMVEIKTSISCRREGLTPAQQEFRDRAEKAKAIYFLMDKGIEDMKEQLESRGFKPVRSNVSEKRPSYQKTPRRCKPSVNKRSADFLAC